MPGVRYFITLLVGTPSSSTCFVTGFCILAIFLMPHLPLTFCLLSDSGGQDYVETVIPRKQLPSAAFFTETQRQFSRYFIEFEELQLLGKGAFGAVIKVWYRVVSRALRAPPLFISTHRDFFAFWVLFDFFGFWFRFWVFSRKFFFESRERSEHVHLKLWSSWPLQSQRLESYPGRIKNISCLLHCLMQSINVITALTWYAISSGARTSPWRPFYCVLVQKENCPFCPICLSEVLWIKGLRG